MDEVQVLSRVMSAAEVAAIRVLPPAPTNVVVSGKTSASLTIRAPWRKSESALNGRTAARAIGDWPKIRAAGSRRLP
jgi:hypothetical protein